MTKIVPLAAGLAAALIAGAALAQAPAAPPVPAARGPGLALSMEAAQAAIAACKAKGFNVGVSVIDSGGVIRALLAGDEARPRAVSSSTEKATMALKTGQVTSVAWARTQKEPAYAAEVAADKTLNARPGGVPLRVGNTLVGAIGVGGAMPSEVDEECGQVGAAKIAGRLK